MKFLVEMDTDVDSDDVVGEALRGKFFKQRYVKSQYGTYRELGCYMSFDYQDDVEELPDEIEKTVWGEEQDYKITWHQARWNGVLCRWFWDGDGFLEFTLPDGTKLVNSDCKKTYGWEEEGAE